MTAAVSIVPARSAASIVAVSDLIMATSKSGLLPGRYGLSLLVADGSAFSCSLCDSA